MSPVVSSSVIRVIAVFITGPVSSPASIFMTCTPVTLSPAITARWIGAAPRQDAAVEIEAAKPRCVENLLRQQQAVGDDDSDIKPEVGKRLAVGGDTEILWRADLDAAAVSEVVDRRLLHLLAPPGRSGRL